MSENPLKPLINTVASISRSLQTHLSRFLIAPDCTTDDLTIYSLTTNPLRPFSSFSLGAETTVGCATNKGERSEAFDQRGAWQGYMDSASYHCSSVSRPADQATKTGCQRIDGYLITDVPRKECQDHFKEILKANPVQAGSQEEFSQWLCHVHNVVNRSLGKVIFPCQRVNARWGKLDCKDRSCDLDGTPEIDIKY